MLGRCKRLLRGRPEFAATAAFEVARHKEFQGVRGTGYLTRLPIGVGCLPLRPISACPAFDAMDVPPDGDKSAAWNSRLWIDRKYTRRIRGLSIHSDNAVASAAGAKGTRSPLARG